MREQESKNQQMNKTTKMYESEQGIMSNSNSLGNFTGNFPLDLELVKKEINYNSDVHFREFNIGRTGIQAAIIFVEGLSDKELIDTHIMKSLMSNFYEEYKSKLS